MTETAGNLAYHLQPIGRVFLKHIVTELFVSGEGWELSPKDHLVVERHDDKGTQYTFKGDSICGESDVRACLETENIDVIELELCLTVASPKEDADGHTFVFNLCADTLLVSGAKLESSHELVRLAEIQLLNESINKIFVGYVEELYLSAK